MYFVFKFINIFFVSNYKLTVVRIKYYKIKLKQNKESRSKTLLSALKEYINNFHNYCEDATNLFLNGCLY